MTGTLSIACVVEADKQEGLGRFVEELRSRAAEHAESRRRLGVTRESIWLGKSAQGDVAVLYVEGDDPEKFLQWLEQSDLPFDRWFAERAQEIWPFDGLGHSGRTLNLFDWETT